MHHPTLDSGATNHVLADLRRAQIQLETILAKVTEVKNRPENYTVLDDPVVVAKFESKDFISEIEYESLCDQAILSNLRDAVIKRFASFGIEHGLEIRDIELFAKQIPKVRFATYEEVDNFKVKGAGQYCTKENTIIVNPFSVLKSEISVDEVGLHEGNHSLEAVLRSYLSDNEIENSLKERIKEDILRGTYGYILHRSGLVIQPAMSLRLRGSLWKFTSQILDKKENKSCINLQSWLEQDCKSDIEVFSREWGNKENAINVLSVIVNAHVFRFDAGMDAYDGPLKTRIPSSVFTPDPSFDFEKLKSFAIQSTREFILLLDAAAAGQVIDMNKDIALTYTLCPEECRCQQAICSLLEASQTDKQRVQSMQQIYSYAEEFREARRKLSNNSDDLEAVVACAQIEQKIKGLIPTAKINWLTSDLFE